MSRQLYYEDVAIGTEIMPLPKVATTMMLVKWAGATGDFSPLHYDGEYAAAHGIGRPIVHGRLKRAWLGQMLNNWIGEKGSLKRLAGYHIGLDYPRSMLTVKEPKEGETWWCKGKVTQKYIQDDIHYLDCEIWLENGKGELTVTGTATVILPSREQRL